MLFILSLTFGVLRFRIGNVLFLKHGYAPRWLAASPRVNTAHALTGRLEGPHCTAAPTNYIEKLKKIGYKKSSCSVSKTCVGRGRRRAGQARAARTDVRGDWPASLKKLLTLNTYRAMCILFINLSWACGTRVQRARHCLH